MSSIALLLALLPPLTIPPDPQTGDQKTSGAGSAPAAALTFDWHGLGNALQDPRDAGLLAALRLADERLLPLTELPDWDGPPAEVMSYAFDLLASPLSLWVGVPETPGPVPVSARLEVNDSPAHVQDLEDRLVSLMGLPPDQVGEPDANQPGLHRLEMPFGVLSHGVPSQGPPRFVVTFGNAPEATPIPQSVKGSRMMAMSLDLKPLQPLMEMGLQQGGPDGEAMRAILDSMGFLGENPMGGTIDMAYDQGQLTFASRVSGVRQLLESMGVKDQAPLSTAAMTKIPKGATYAQVSRFEAMTMLNSIELMMPAEVKQKGNPLDMFRDFTGLDLATDFFEPMGDTMGFYLAPENGGGFLSATGFFSVDDPETLAHGISSLGDLAAGPLSEEAEGHVRIETWQPTALEGAHGWRIVFPQLPIPVEPALLLSDGWLYFSLFPDSTLTAAQQGLAPQSSVLDAPRFQRALAQNGRSEFIGIQYSDTPAQLSGAYSFARLLGKALDNLLLVPNGLSANERTPVVPALPTLSQGAQPTLILTFWEDDLLVSKGTMDGSIIANCSGIAGSYMALVMGVGMGTTWLTTGRLQSQALAIEERPISETDRLITALEMYRVANDGQWPTSLEDLLQPSSSGEPYIYYLPTDDWGNQLIYVPPTGEDGWPSILSYGADGVEGGEGANEDIYYY